MDNITNTSSRRSSIQIAALHKIYLEIRSAPVAVTETTREAASEALFKMLSPKNNPRSLDSTKFINGDELVLPTAQTNSNSTKSGPSSNDALAMEIATEILKLDESAITDKEAAIKKEALLLQWPAIYKRFMEEHKEYNHGQIS